MSEHEKTETEGVETAQARNSASAADSSMNETINPKSEPNNFPYAEEFARMKAEYEARYDQMLRAIAEYDNSKKRAERDKEEFLKYALEGMVKDLIPTVDNIERAIESTKEAKDFDALAEGIQMIYKQFLSFLERRGVTPIEAVGELFDPTQHQAILHLESESVPENRVIQEFQRGYLLHNRVIRPAMVSVSKGGVEKEL